jgi:beta-xylosidase
VSDLARLTRGSADPKRRDTQTNECWATDAAFVNGKFYFYVSAGGGQIAVMVANSITGPWSDPLGKPLMSPALGAAQKPSTTFRGALPSPRSPSKAAR